MLEIFAIIMLCIGNSKRAKQRGRSGGGAVAYTLGLWIGMEIFGALLATLLFPDFWVIYLFALIFAVIGGVISYVISKHGEQKSPQDQPYELYYPCTVRVFRDSSEQYRSSKFFFYLNGEVLDAIDDDSMLIAYTKFSHNTIQVRFDDEQFMRDTYQFRAVPTGTVDIHCAGGKFLTQPAVPVAAKPGNQW